MIRLTYCLRRKPGMGVEEFQRHWREVHAPLVAARAETLGIRRYVQQHTVHPEVNAGLQRRNGGSPEAFDGVAELWFDDLDAMASDDPDVVRASRELLEDEERFIDLASSPIFLTREDVVVG